jgi:hypothetical protein
VKRFNPRPAPPPPCPQRCWDALPLGAWAYSDDPNTCGHTYDPDVGLWLWKGHHHPPKRAA